MLKVRRKEPLSLTININVYADSEITNHRFYSCFKACAVIIFNHTSKIYHIKHVRLVICIL